MRIITCVNARPHIQTRIHKSCIPPSIHPSIHTCMCTHPSGVVSSVLVGSSAQVSLGRHGSIIMGMSRTPNMPEIPKPQNLKHGLKLQSSKPCILKVKTRSLQNLRVSTQRQLQYCSSASATAGSVSANAATPPPAAADARLVFHSCHSGSVISLHAGKKLRAQRRRCSENYPEPRKQASAGVLSTTQNRRLGFRKEPIGKASQNQKERVNKTCPISLRPIHASASCSPMHTAVALGVHGT